MKFPGNKNKNTPVSILREMLELAEFTDFADLLELLGFAEFSNFDRKHPGTDKIIPNMITPLYSYRK